MLRSSRAKHNGRVQVVSALSVADVAGVVTGHARSPPEKILAHLQEDAAVEEQAVFAVPDFPAEIASTDEKFYPLEAVTREGFPASAASPEATGLIYQELVEAAAMVFDAAAKKMVPDSAAIIGAVRQAYIQLKEGGGLLAEIVRQRRDFRSWPERAANVAILSMRLGMERPISAAAWPWGCAD